jgi:hypothetical protein
MRMHSMICGQGFGYYCRMGENLIFIHDDYINATG